MGQDHLNQVEQKLKDAIDTLRSIGVSIRSRSFGVKTVGHTWVYSPNTDNIPGCCGAGATLLANPTHPCSHNAYSDTANILGIEVDHLHSLVYGFDNAVEYEETVPPNDPIRRPFFEIGQRVREYACSTGIVYSEKLKNYPGA